MQNVKCKMIILHFTFCILQKSFYILHFLLFCILHFIYFSFIPKKSLGYHEHLYDVLDIILKSESDKRKEYAHIIPGLDIWRTGCTRSFAIKFEKKILAPGFIIWNWLETGFV